MTGTTEFDPLIKSISKNFEGLEKTFANEDSERKTSSANPLEKFDKDRINQIIRSEKITKEEALSDVNGILEKKARPQTPSEGYMKNVDAINHTAQTKSKDEIINEIKKDSDAAFNMAKKKNEGILKEKIIKKQRKLCSYTLGTDIVELIDDLSKDIHMNKSRFIEHLVKKYKAEKVSTQKTALRDVQSEDVNNLPIDKISEKVFEYLVSNGYINQAS